MSSQEVNYVIAFILLLQGLSHGKALWDLVTMLRDWDDISTPTIRIWLAPKLSPKSSVQIVCVFWLLAAVGFVVAAMGLSGVLEVGTAWKPLVGMAALISILGIAVIGGRWPNAPTKKLSNADTIIALVIDVAVIIWLVLAG